MKAKPIRDFKLFNVYSFETRKTYIVDFSNCVFWVWHGNTRLGFSADIFNRNFEIIED